jgi:predicted MarR family transcription regulator
MEAHPTFDQRWCERCQVAVSPEDVDDIQVALLHPRDVVV